MRTKLIVYAFVVLALSTSKQAPAQTPGGLMNMFTAMMGAAIVNNARIEWSKIRSDETSCIEQELRQRGASIGTLIQNGIVPNDPRVAGIRYDCRTAALNPPYIAPNANSGNNRRDQNSQQSQSSSPSSSPYVIDGLALGEKVAFNSGAYNKYHCSPSDKFPGFTWCHKDETKRDRRLEITLSNSILHAQDGTAWYINRFIEPATFGKNEVRGEINRLSAKYGQSPAREIRMPHKDGLPDAIMVVWGEVELEQLSDEEVRTVANGGRHEGILVAFLGDLEKSAKRGTQLYRLSGGAGYVWIATYNNAGRGVLRFLLTVDASQISQPNEIATTKGSQSAQAPTQPAPPPPKPAPPPRIKTARLREAGLFLDDAKRFIGQQTSIPAIAEMAKEAATLQLALNQFDERGAVESMQRLSDLLKPVPGFADFKQQQQAERNREEARHLSEGRIQAKENEYFIDGYLRGHLGEPTTQPMLNLRAQIEDALKSNTIEQITKANEAVALYVKNDSLTEAYKESARRFEHPEPPLPRTPTGLPDILTEKSKFLVDGPAEEIVLLYNASPTAPKVWKNVRGDVVFQDETASLCFAQPTVELGVARYVDHYLGDHGARKVTSVSPPCELSSAGTTTDIIAFRRGNLLNSREDYILALAKLLEGDTFRRYETISNYDSIIRDRQTLSLQIESDLESGSRKGFGVVSVTETPVACVVPPSKAEWSDGLRELLKRNADVIAPTITSDWQYVDTSNTNLAFLGLQRHQCGYLLGAESDLREIMLALRREKMKYAFAPVWWSENEVVQATFDVHDAVQQELRKKLDVERKRKEEEALQAERDKNKQSKKSEIERKLREANGTKARGLMNYIHDLVSGMAEKRAVENADLFSTYSNWLDRRFADQWETFNVSSDVADFGVVQWENRPLDAVVVKTIVHQKNRFIGRYEDKCYLFGLVADEEFSMLRDSFAIDCSDGPDVNKWKVGERFQSRWNAD